MISAAVVVLAVWVLREDVNSKRLQRLWSGSRRRHAIGGYASIVIDGSQKTAGREPSLRLRYSFILFDPAFRRCYLSLVSFAESRRRSDSCHPTAFSVRRSSRIHQRAQTDRRPSRLALVLRAIAFQVRRHPVNVCPRSCRHSDHVLFRSVHRTQRPVPDTRSRVLPAVISLFPCRIVGARYCARFAHALIASQFNFTTRWFGSVVWCGVPS